MTKKASSVRKFRFSVTIVHSSSGMTLGSIFFDDVKSLKYWFGNLTNESLCVNDYYITYE